MSASNRIRFHCEHCEHTLSVPAEHAGKQGKCPHCGQRVTIPAGKDLPETTETPVSGERKCPSCGAGLQAISVICVQCGLDLRTGRKLITQGLTAKSVAAATKNKLKGVSPAAHKWYDVKIARPPAAVLQCAGCTVEYWLNNDSTIRPGSDFLEEIREDLQRKGSRILHAPAEPALLPDAVAPRFFEALPAEQAEEERHKNCAHLEQALDDPARRWACLSCGKVNRYRTAGDISLEVPVEDLLDVQVAVFEAVLETELGRRLGTDTTERIPLCLSYHHHDPALYVRERLARHGDIRSVYVPRTGEEVLLEVNKITWLSRDVCLATGSCNNGMGRYRAVRRSGQWKATETDSLYKAYQLQGQVLELYNLYGPEVLHVYGKIYGLEVDRKRTTRG